MCRPRPRSPHPPARGRGHQRPRRPQRSRRGGPDLLRAAANAGTAVIMVCHGAGGRDRSPDRHRGLFGVTAFRSHQPRRRRSDSHDQDSIVLIAGGSMLASALPSMAHSSKATGTGSPRRPPVAAGEARKQGDFADRERGDRQGRDDAGPARVMPLASIRPPSRPRPAHATPTMPIARATMVSSGVPRPRASSWPRSSPPARARWPTPSTRRGCRWHTSARRRRCRCRPPEARPGTRIGRRSPVGAAAPGLAVHVTRCPTDPPAAATGVKTRLHPGLGDEGGDRENRAGRRGRPWSSSSPPPRSGRRGSRAGYWPASDTGGLMRACAAALVAVRRKTVSAPPSARHRRVDLVRGLIPGPRRRGRRGGDRRMRRARGRSRPAR